MKNQALICLTISLLFFATCDRDTKHDASPGLNPVLQKIIDAHGGIGHWKNKRTLSFATGDQIHTIDLQTRDTKIVAPDFSMGSKNGKVWIKQDSAAFKGSPRFYHSLMFYFHAMPFVLADPGIHYEMVSDKTINGTKFERLKMTFEPNTGDAPKDQYILYYHPDSYKMEWLAYSSTYQSQQKSNNFNIIHYKKWKKMNGLLLPIELQWHRYKNGKVGLPRGNPTVITDKKLSDQPKDENFYAIPESATVDSASTN